jgi:hypothetical protein
MTDRRCLLHPSWSRAYKIVGKDGYPLEWHETIKHAVREAAGHRCVRCGHPYRNGEHGRGEWSPCDSQCVHRGPYRYRHGPEDEWFYTDGADCDESWIGEAGIGQSVGIEVHAQWRILTVHHLDGDKANCRWWNLTSLCQRCHLQIQGKVQMGRVWPWEHSEWFRPYVAGFYAWTYLGEDLTRAEVEARLDELLGLERAA